MVVKATCGSEPPPEQKTAACDVTLEHEQGRRHSSSRATIGWLVGWMDGWSVGLVSTFRSPPLVISRKTRS